MRWLAALILITIGSSVLAEEYYCPVTAKRDFYGPYSVERLRLSQYSIRIIDDDSGAQLSRCYLPSLDQEAKCESFSVDRVELDAATGHRKYYVFQAHYDVQLFEGLSFVENNGVGTVAWGRCFVTD